MILFPLDRYKYSHVLHVDGKVGIQDDTCEYIGAPLRLSFVRRRFATKQLSVTSGSRAGEEHKLPTKVKINLLEQFTGSDSREGVGNRQQRFEIVLAQKRGNENPYFVRETRACIGLGLPSFSRL